MTQTGERPTAALQRGGIEYVEIRSLDINLFDPCGVNQNTMRFMEALLVYCLLMDSPKFDDAELKEISRNQTQTALKGRDPEFRLSRNSKPVSIKDWANEIIDGVMAVAEEIDRHDGNDSYVAAARMMREIVAEPDATPSARIIAELEKSNTGFFDFSLAMARNHRDYFAAIAKPSDVSSMELQKEAVESLRRQSEIEASDTISLDDYLAQYFD